MARYTVCLKEHRDNIDYNRLKADAQKLQVADPSLSFDAAIAKATENVIAELKAQEAEIMALLGEEPVAEAKQPWEKPTYRERIDPEFTRTLSEQREFMRRRAQAEGGAELPEDILRSHHKASVESALRRGEINTDNPVVKDYPDLIGQYQKPVVLSAPKTPEAPEVERTIPKPDKDLTETSELEERIQSLHKQIQALDDIDRPRDMEKHNAKYAKLVDRRDALLSKLSAVKRAAKSAHPQEAERTVEPEAKGEVQKAEAEPEPVKAESEDRFDKYGSFLSPDLDLIINSMPESRNKQYFKSNVSYELGNTNKASFSNGEYFYQAGKRYKLKPDGTSENFGTDFSSFERKLREGVENGTISYNKKAKALFDALVEEDRIVAAKAAEDKSNAEVAERNARELAQNTWAAVETQFKGTKFKNIKVKSGEVELQGPSYRGLIVARKPGRLAKGENPWYVYHIAYSSEGSLVSVIPTSVKGFATQGLAKVFAMRMADAMNGGLDKFGDQIPIVKVKDAISSVDPAIGYSASQYAAAVAKSGGDPYVTVPVEKPTGGDEPTPPKRKKPEAKTEDKPPKAESAGGDQLTPPRAEDFATAAEYHKARLAYRNVASNVRSAKSEELAKLNKQISAVKASINKKIKTPDGLMPPAIVQDSLRNLNAKLESLEAKREALVAPGEKPDTALQKDTPDKQRGMKPEALVAMLPGYAKRMMKEGKLVVVKDAAEAQAYSGQRIPDTSQGFYYPRQDRVVLIASMASNKENLMMVLNHELLHRAEFVDPDVKATMKRLDDQFFERFKLAKLGKGTAAEREAYRRIAYSTSPKEFHMLEFRAYLVSEYNKNPESLSGYIKKLVQDFIAAIRIGLMRAGVNLKELTAADMNRIAETYGAQAYRRGEGEVTLFSNTAVDELWQELNTQPSTYLNDFKIKSKKGLGKAIETKDDLFYAALTQNQLVDLLEEILPEGRQFAKERNNYDVEESNWHNRADELAKRWENIVEADRLFRSEKNRQQLRLEQAKIADWMHESTTSGIDARLPRPKDTGKNGIELHKYDQLKAKWDNLSEDSRKLINDVDKFHQDVTARLLDTLTDKVEQAEMPKETKAEIIKEIKDKFNKVQGPYFPLMRTGDYWIDHADGVEMFETEIEWKAAKKALKEKGTPVYGSGKSLKNFNRVEGVDANFIESVNDLIDTVADEDQANALKDGVFQLYLQALPENSMRKRMIHRKNTPGWEKDALRSFSKKAFHDGKQLAKLRFAPAMRRVLTDISNTVRYAESDKRYAMLKDRIQNIRDAIVLFEQGMDFESITAKFNDDTEALRPIRRFSRFKDEIDRDQAMTEYLKQQEALLEDVDKFRDLDFENKETRAANLLKALNKSYENMMKPSGNAASHFINQTVFTWMLGFNPGSALINLSQVPFVSAPVMAGRHNFQATNRAFWKAYKDFIGGKEPNGDDMGIYSKLDDNERKMYEALTENGLFDRTRAHDLAGFGDEGVARGTLIRTFMGWSTYLFHKAEVMNREVTALMAFRLEYKKTGSLRQAIDYADRIVRDTHFDYAAANRPDLFQGNFRRVAFQFKMYSQGVTYLWGKTFRDAFITQLKTPEQKAEAKRIFYAMVGTQMIAAGAMGLPIGGILVGAQMAASAFDDDDEPIDVEVEIRKALTYVFGDTIGKIIAKGPLSAATGLDFHSRLSLSDLWIREPDKELEGKDTAYYLLKTAFGPAGGLLEDVFVGGKLWGEGNKERAIEKWLPHAVSSLVKSGRMIEEGGAAALSGEMIYEMNALEKAFQAAGLRSLGLSERQEQNAAIKNREAAVGETKAKLLHKAVNARMKGDNEAYKEAMDDIKEFNAKYPKLRITPASIMKSIKTRKKNKANTKEGLVVKPKYEFIRDEENFF